MVVAACALLLPINLVIANDREPVRVAAAVSLKEAVEELSHAHEQRTGQPVVATFGSSGQLKAQVENGAPIDVFIPASVGHLDELAGKGLVDAGTRRTIARNALVLVVPTGAAAAPASFADLATPAVRRVAVGEPRTVPAGQYAAEALAAMNVDVGGKVVYGASVRQVLDYVIRGEVSAGVVYATDARVAGGAVRVVATAPPDAHDPIEYPAAVVTASPRRDVAAAFVEFLMSPDAQATFANRGFQPVPAPTTIPASAR